MSTITNVRRDDKLRNSVSFRVFTDGDVPRDTTSVWFDENNIRSLKFKCKAWNAVARAGTKISCKQIVPVIAERFKLQPDQFELSFSLKAGCPCGCSPGYVGKVLVPSYYGELSRANVWMNGIVLSDADRVAYDKVAEKQKVKLAAEIYAHDHAKEIAEAAEVKRKKDLELAALETARNLSLQSASL
jgi:hypothetical protein